MFCLLMAAPLWAQQSPETEISGLSRKEARRTMRGFKFFAEIGAYADVYRDASDEDDWIQTPPTNSSKWSATVSAGYQINNSLFLGIGVGADYLPVENEWFMPIFAQARINFLNKKISPYLDLRYGGSPFSEITSDEESEGFGEVGLGVRIATSTKHSIYTGIYLHGGMGLGLKEYISTGLRVGYEF